MSAMKYTAPMTFLICLLATSAAYTQMSPEEAMRLLKDKEKAATQVESGDDGGTGKQLRIGSWNIEWLGTPSSRSGIARDKAQSVDDIARYIASARLDVLSLQEIRPDDGVDDDPDSESQIIADALAKLSEREGQTWDHILIPTKGGSGSQLTGVAWNTEVVTRIGDPIQIHPEAGKVDDNGRPVKLWTAGPRAPYGLILSAGEGLTDIVVVPIHWKSDYNGTFEDQRAKEAQEIVDGLPVVFNDSDVLIIGDSNCGTTREQAIQVLGAAGWKDLNARDLPTHVADLSLDRVFVPVSQPEFEKSRQQVFKMRGFSPEQFKERLSDHYMVITTVSVMEDDD